MEALPYMSCTKLVVGDSRKAWTVDDAPIHKKAARVSLVILRGIMMICNQYSSVERIDFCFYKKTRTNS